MHLLTWKASGQRGDQLEIRLQQNAKTKDYAILSHRWGDDEDEVSYDDMVAGRPEAKKGYGKLLNCCKQARRDGLQYAWIDTCCINKSSSAELSEAITSMYAYYEQSTVCYAYLDDVLVDPAAKEDFDSSSFSKSLWFTRGWTLQELIAPQRVKFFDRSWAFIGYKTDTALCRKIENITGIDSVVLRLPSAMKLLSVAKRMSWAARRQTTRIEDRAYSLMGIFSVYMPPLYGEGVRAFIRLQEAILSTTNDHSIFAWTSPPTDDALSGGLELVSTMLALSPDQFEWSNNFKPLPQNERIILSTQSNKFDYAVTNVGLSIRLPLHKFVNIDGLYAAFLACAEGESQLPSAILLSTTSGTPHNHFWRTNCNEGPIERSSRLWFPVDGRNGMITKDLYILPKFTSVSADRIEPPWKLMAPETCATKAAFHKSSPPFAMNEDILINLHHVPDPSFERLAILQKLHHQLSTSHPRQLFELVNERLNLSQSLPPRLPEFHGRVAALKDLRQILCPPDMKVALQTGKRPIPSCVVSGTAGIGKTQLAIEFCYSGYENLLFDKVIWIHGTSRERTLADFRETATTLHLINRESSDKDVIRAVLRWLANGFDPLLDAGRDSPEISRWLLVFDNVEHFSYITPFWPPFGPGSVLVTSRDAALSTKLGSKSLHLDPFIKYDATDYLKELTATNGNFSAISQYLGGHPLALSTVGALTAHSGLSVEELLACLDPHTPYEESRRLISISLAIEKLSQPAQAVLRLTSFLDTSFVPDTMFVSPEISSTISYPHIPQNLVAPLEELASQGLIRRTSEPPGTSVHRLVQRYLIEQMPPEMFQTGFVLAIILVHTAWARAGFDKDGNDPSPGAYEAILPHIYRLREFANRLQDSEDGREPKKKLFELLRFAERAGSSYRLSVSER